MRWTTRHEITFVMSLGRYRRPSSDEECLDAVMSYREAMALRSNWGDIDKDAVAEACDRRIQRLTHLIKENIA